MGNKLCKKKVDNVDNNQKVPSKFDKIINRLHVRFIYTFFFVNLLHIFIIN